MLKIFIYLNDVDESSGPFIYIPFSKYSSKWGGVFPQKPPRGCYPEIGEVEKIVPADAIRKMTGRAGTVIFCDTTGLHQGGYATGGERLMFTAGYYSQASAWPAQIKIPEKVEIKSEAQKFALQYNSNHITSRLWRRIKNK